MRSALLLALVLNASLLGVRCLQERHIAEAARQRGPVFTQAHADVLAHLSLGELIFRDCDLETEPGSNCITPLLRVSGCSVQIVPDPAFPRSLFVGGDALFNPFDEYPASGARFESVVEAPFFRGEVGQ